MFIRRLPKFEYHAPSTVDEALNLLSGDKGTCKILAGGTDLLVDMKFRRATPEHLINLKGIEELKGISLDDSNRIRIGGLTTLGEIERSEIVREKLPILWDAARVMASVQIRNLGTVGGNLCSAWPSADSAPPLIALNAVAILKGVNGERAAPVKDLFIGPGQSVKKDDEILTEVSIPIPKENSAGAYFKLMRRHAMDLALVGVAAQIELASDKKTCSAVRIALGAVASIPVRAPEAEAMIIHRAFDANIAKAAGQIASENISPRSSIRASGEYRQEMVGVLVKKALMTSFERIQSQV
jgi:carbon-monoxide dehydrogenase medium subunit